MTDAMTARMLTVPVLTVPVLTDSVPNVSVPTAALPLSARGRSDFRTPPAPLGSPTSHGPWRVSKRSRAASTSAMCSSAQRPSA